MWLNKYIKLQYQANKWTKCELLLLMITSAAFLVATAV